MLRRRAARAEQARAANEGDESDADAYSVAENTILQERLGDYELFESENSKSINMEVPSTTAKIAFKNGDSLAWGWASAVVRASPEEILAYSWDTLSRGKRREDDLEKAVDEAPNKHNQLVYNKKATPKIIDDRDFLGRMIWKRTETGYVFVSNPEENELRPVQSGVVRGKYPSAMKIKRLNDSETRIEYVIHPDAGGSLPAWLMNRYVKSNLRKVTEIQEFHQSCRGVDQYDADDGKAVGELMMVKTKQERHRTNGETIYDARLRAMLKKYKGLKEIGAKYGFFSSIMSRVLKNKLRPAGDVSTKLCNVSLKEGRTIGAGLALSLASNLTAEAAVDEWIGRYRALKELDREEVWFRPMMDRVALRLLGEVSWGLKMRLFMGAGLSMLDIASDINVIVLYRNTPGEEKYGDMLMWMIVVCLAIQLLVVYVQNKTNRLKLLKEVLIVLSGLKPGKSAERARCVFLVFDAFLLAVKVITSSLTRRSSFFSRRRGRVPRVTRLGYCRGKRI